MSLQSLISSALFLAVCSVRLVGGLERWGAFLGWGVLGGRGRLLGWVWFCPSGWVRAWSWVVLGLGWAPVGAFPPCLGSCGVV